MTIQTFTLESTTTDDVKLQSYVCLPSSAMHQQPAPAILVASEWWGMVEHPKKVAERLAEAGFAAVTMDIYGEGKLTTDAAKAHAWMMEAVANPDHLIERCCLIMQDFIALDGVDGERIGVVGYCFGGKIALDMAREGLPLKAVATFHGNPTSQKNAQAGKFQAKVLIAHGEADSLVPMNAIDTLQVELDNAGVAYQVDIYPNAKHGFTNPEADQRAAENGVDLGYNEAAATASWQKMIAFMQTNLA